MKRIKQQLISAFFPNKCMGCGEIIAEGKNFCDFCEKHIEKNDLDNFCTVCGYEKGSCVCNYNIYRFEKLISVFKNNGIAQSAYYSYKFKHRQHYAHFFASEIADAVNLLYPDIGFDCICAVPVSRSLFGKSKFDHCDYLCKDISKILNIPYAYRLLDCQKSKKQQHKLPIKKRLSNVNGKFYYNYRVDGTTVLLIDDIRTTGATLDECAKTLLYAGAEKVYCATALTTVFKQKNQIAK